MFNIVRTFVQVLNTNSISLHPRRAVHIVDNPILMDGLKSLNTRKDTGSLCVFYCLYNVECSKELVGIVLPSRFYHRTLCRRTKIHPHHLYAWFASNGQTMANCGMTFLLRFFLCARIGGFSNVECEDIFFLRLV